MKKNTKGIVLSTAFFCMAPCVALAGGVATVVSDGAVTQVEFAGPDLMRLTTAGEDGYMLLRDGRLYSVVSDGGESMVIDVGQSMEAMGGLMEGAMEQAFFDAGFQQILSFNDTGRRETVAGIQGDVYEMTAIDERGQTVTSSVVVSADQNVREMTEAMLSMLSVLVQSVGEETASHTFMQEEIIGRGLGVLRQGSDFSLALMDSTAPSASRFELPAAPMEMPAMDGVFGAGMPNVFSDQLERQQRRVESRTEREVDRAADNAVDGAVNRVFRRVFGN